MRGLSQELFWMQPAAARDLAQHGVELLRCLQTFLASVQAATEAPHVVSCGACSAKARPRNRMSSEPSGAQHPDGRGLHGQDRRISHRSPNHSMADRGRWKGDSRQKSSSPFFASGKSATFDERDSVDMFQTRKSGNPGVYISHIAVWPMVVFPTHTATHYVQLGLHTPRFEGGAQYATPGGLNMARVQFLRRSARFFP